MKRKKKYEKYLGIPFKHLGRDTNGIDCYGLLMLYYKEILNVELKDWWYEIEWYKKGKNYFLDNYKDYSFEKVKDIQKHDVILFCMDINSPIPNHDMIVVEPPNILLSAEKKGVVLVDLNNRLFKRRIEGVYRLCQN